MQTKPEIRVFPENLYEFAHTPNQNKKMTKNARTRWNLSNEYVSVNFHARNPTKTAKESWKPGFFSENLYGFAHAPDQNEKSIPADRAQLALSDEHVASPIIFKHPLENGKSNLKPVFCFSKNLYEFADRPDQNKKMT